MNLGLLCSGQGLKHPAMFAVTGEAPKAVALFDRADALRDGRDPRALVRDADEAGLHGNKVGQVLCTLQTVAAGLDTLARQISTKIRWADNLAAAVEAGASAFWSSGPAGRWPRWRRARIPTCRPAASTISGRPTACGRG